MGKIIKWRTREERTGQSWTDYLIWGNKNLNEEELDEIEKAEDDLFAERCENDKWRDLEADLI